MITLAILITGALIGNRIYRYRMPERMMDAAQHGDAATVKAMLDKGMNPNFNLSPNGPTPLSAAIYSGSLDTVNVLLGHGAKFGEFGSTFVDTAFDEKHPEIARTLLLHGAPPFSYRGYYEGYTLLMERAEMHDLAGVQVLLDLKFNVNARVQRGLNQGYTALMGAASQGQDKIVKLLLQHGADVNLQGKDGNTALSLANKNGHRQTATLLRQAGEKK